MKDLNWAECFKFFTSNPLAMLFILANLFTNMMASYMMSNFSTPTGIFASSVGVVCSAALALSLPIIMYAMGIAFQNDKGRAFFLFMVFLPFQAVDIMLSYSGTTGRIEYSKQVADQSKALTDMYSNIGKQAAGSIKECTGARGCDSGQRTSDALEAAERLENTKLAWSLHQTFSPEFITFLIKGLTLVCSLGGSVMGMIAGMDLRKRSHTGATPAKKNPPLHSVA